ncbi:34434_t:CDS:1, partial [Gigaspora margarita]
SYLKEVLNEIAILDKNGHYYNCYHLKTESSQNISAKTVSVAPQVVGVPLENVGNEEDYSYEALSLAFQKNHSSQLESSDMSEATDRASEPLSILYGP